MIRSLSFLIAFLSAGCASLFTSSDFTPPGLFTGSIEGPCFDANGTLFVVNFGHNGTIASVGADGTPQLFLELPAGSVANSIKFDRAGTMFLADYPMHNVLRVDMRTRTVTVHAHDTLFNQPNDLCIDRHDHLFASDPHWKSSIGKLWRIDPDGSTHLLEDSMGTTNGIELSPDDRTLYVNESIQRNVWRYDVDDAGNISNKSLFHSFPDFGMDGMKCDAEGNLYVTRYGKGSIAILSPRGELIREIPLTGKNCSNLVFGGTDGRTVFVTMQDRKLIERFLNDIPGKGR